MPGQPPFDAILISALVLGAVACNRPDDPRFGASAPRASAAPAPVLIRSPEKLTSIETDELDPLGRPIRVSCASCHSQRKHDTLPASASELKEFHQNLSFEHGTLTCAQCHQAGDATSLHLADGRKIPMTEVMLLCGQCHGPQYRDYGKGAHGGMQGYWDRTRGGRTRNNCVDCHDPHLPRYQPGQPVLLPRDRGLENQRSGAAAKGAPHG